MKIVVASTDAQWLELTYNRPLINWLRVDKPGSFSGQQNADAFFSLQSDDITEDFISLEKPVLINSVVATLPETAPSNVYRINGWATFLQRPVWEIAGRPSEEVETLFKNAGIKMNRVKDEPGFVTARIIAMIINEGYFAIEDGVSSKAEIDTAMKLGTNYPHGPFEWAAKIGTDQIFMLLQKLHEKDPRYAPSALLMQEAKTKDI